VITWKVTTDGGCPANPGPGAFAFVIDKGDGTKITRSGFLPVATNNTAEYRAVTAAAIFLHSVQQHPERIEFWSDSELIVRQLNGVYQCRNEMLHPVYLEAKKAIETLRKVTHAAVTLQWFRRENNMEADELCNEVLRKRGIEIVSKKKASK
jgi:ribonuclease HI